MRQRQEMRRIVILLLYLLSGSLSGSGVPTFEHLTVGDGLSHNTVYTIMQDKSGLFWIGTRQGLNRYDGYDFQTFTTEEDANSLNGPIVLSLLEDRRGRIWVGHRDDGISIYDKSTGRFTPFTLGSDGQEPVDWATISVRALFQDSRGLIWIGTFGGGVIVLDEAGQLLHHLSTYTISAFSGKISNDFVFDFAEDKDGNVYVATSGKGLNVVRFGEKRLEVLHAPGDDLSSFSKALCLASDGSVWVATSGNGLSRYQTSNKTWQLFSAPTAINHNIVTDVTEDENGAIWVSTDGGGLNVIYPATGEQKSYTYSPSRTSSLNTDALYKLLFDAGGNLWIGSFNGGLNIYRANQPPFVTDRQYDMERKMGLRSVLSLAESSGTTWLGTDGGGLFSFGEQLTQVKAFNSSPAPFTARPQVQSEDVDKVITALAPDGNGGLWYGSYAKGLGYIDLSSRAVTKFRHDEKKASSLAHDNVWDMEIDSAGGLWIGLLGGGLDYLPPGAAEFQHFVTRPNDDQSLSGLQVVDLLLDQNGLYLWVATENNGLNRLDIKTGIFKQFRHSTTDPGSISSDRIRYLFQDQTGVVWIGTEYSGLNSITEGETTFVRYDKANGYPFKVVNGIETDAEGHFWITGLKRIIRWNRTDNTFKELPTEVELGYNLYNPGAIQKLPTGELVFGGVNGFSVLQPSRTSPPARSPAVLIADFQLANRSILPGNQDGRTILSGDLNGESTKINLSYRDRGIAFLFAAPTSSAPEEVRYAFRLEGFDQEWNETEPGKREAYYSSLKGGTYKLRVKAAGGDGIWGPERVALKVVVKPPFWRTSWFVAAMVFLGVLLIYLFNRYLLTRQRELYQQQAMAQEQEILRLRNKNLKEEVASKQSKLGASILQMAHKNEFLNDLKNKIQQLEAKENQASAKSLRSVVRVINHELKQEDYWEQFQLIFDQGFQDFVSRLRARHSNLSNNDSRLCCFIRMQLNNREIASVLNITLNGVEQAKYRLKKKMELPRELSLNEYVRQFG
jgi:ligand-binding sensor domain-containing protein/DNA-binding CsgD family transcriptional regulator